MPGNYVVFTLNNEVYGIDILKAQEVIRAKGMVFSKVPKVPKFISGIINLRGDVVPIMSLKARFGLTTENTEEKRIIIVEDKKMIVGFLVDTIVEILQVREEEILPPTEEVKLRCEYVDAIICEEKRMIFIVNVNKSIEFGRSVERCLRLI